MEGRRSIIYRANLCDFLFLFFAPTDVVERRIVIESRFLLLPCRGKARHTDHATYTRSSIYLYIYLYKCPCLEHRTQQLAALLFGAVPQGRSINRSASKKRARHRWVASNGDAAEPSSDEHSHSCGVALIASRVHQIHLPGPSCTSAGPAQAAGR